MLLFLFQADIRKIIQGVQFATALKNSLISTFISTVISVSLAYILAFCVHRTQIPHKTIITVLLTLPMLIPSVSHGMGLILLFGSNGIITNIFNLKTSIYGFAGVITGSVMYSFPVAFLMISDILKYQDYTPYEACTVNFCIFCNIYNDCNRLWRSINDWREIHDFTSFDVSRSNRNA